MNEQSNDFGVGYAIGRDTNNGYGNGGFGYGYDWIWIILLLALCGNGGWGNGGNMNYELGKLATTNDVASGFTTSEMMSDLNDILLGQANIQQTLCQGFSGVNQTINTLGYQNQTGFNAISREIADCCCGIKTELLHNRYLNEKQTCDLIVNQNANTQRIIDYMTGEKIAALQAENSGLKAQISNDRQSAYLINELKPVAKPAYITCSPYQSVYGFNQCGCGCGCNF